MEHTFNMNAADCIKSATEWGVTHYTNICSGASYSVESGLMDKLAMLGILGMCGAMALLFLALIVMMVKI